jgi:hypothetical protein
MGAGYDPGLEAGLSRAFVVGDVLRQSWRVLARSWRPHLALLAAAHAPWTAYAFAPSLKRAVADGLGAPAADHLTLALAALGLGLASSLRLHMAGRQLEGEPPDLGESLRAIASRSAEIWLFWAFGALALCGAAALYAIPGLSAFGALWPIPGVAFATRYLVAGPAQIMEGTGPLASLRRSDELTSLARWEVFGFVLTAWFAAAATLAPLLLLDAIWRASAWRRLRVAAGRAPAPEEAREPKP